MTDVLVEDPTGFADPSHDLAAEQAVLGSMLLSKDAIADILELVSSADFYRPAHRVIFDAIITMFGRGEGVDTITVYDRLYTTGESARVGGAPYLLDLASGVPTTVNAGYYAKIVNNHALLRRLTETTDRIKHYITTPSGDTAEEVLLRAQQEIMAVTGGHTVEDYAPLAEIMPGALDEIESIGNRGGQISGVPTGFVDLDELTNGLQPGQMIVVAARPAIGKSTLAVDILRSASIKYGIPGVMFSLEMSRNEIIMRLLSAECRIPLHNIRSGHLSDGDWTKLAARMSEIAEAPFYIDDSVNLRMPQIHAKCRRLKQRGGLGIVVIDYLQLMTGGGKPESRQNEVSEISRSVKLLAKELGVPVVAVSQLNRNAEQRTDKRPAVSDLRESGSIEQDADMVILLHREDAHEKESPRAGEADLIVAKHRNGPTRTVTVAFQGHYSRFVDMAGPVKASQHP